METGVVKGLHPERLRALEEWQRATSITLTQVNGQRKYGGPPPGWRGPAPGSGCEVFITRIPQNIFEDCLIPLFQSVAPLYEFRLMMNFSGQNRGFAYAKYGDPASAVAAIQALNQYQLQEGVRLMVRKSTEKRLLCLGDVPSGMGREELLMVLQMLSDGVEDVTLKSFGPKEKDISVLVHYSSHYAASMAKKVLGQAFKKQFGACISVRWMSYVSKSRQDGSSEEIFSAKPSLPPPHFQFKPPTPLCNPLPPLPSPPAQPTFPPHHSQLFSRAVGGPAPHVKNGIAPLTIKRPDLPSTDAVTLLKWLCELHGLGDPLYEVHYHHTGPDGFLHFTYRVLIPRLPIPFCGVVQILPGTSLTTTEDEVHRAAAKQVVKVMCIQS